MSRRFSDITKMDFKDVLRRFLSERTKYHLYDILKTASTGATLNFDFSLQPSEKSNHIIVHMDLCEFGTLQFEVDMMTSYGTIVTNNYRVILENFLENYSETSSYDDSRKPLL